MSLFKISSNQKDNSHPSIKIALRKWMLQKIKSPKILDIYGANGLMYEKVWRILDYSAVTGEVLSYLQKQSKFDHTIFDIDPYASPFEAINLVCSKALKKNIGIVCTDGCLRRVCMMRTSIPEFISNCTGWAKRDLSLMASIYHRYPSYLRYLLTKIIGDFTIDSLAIKYGNGTWKQATVYFAACLSK